MLQYCACNASQFWTAVFASGCCDPKKFEFPYFTFITFSGVYQFTRLPFGPKRAPSYFQEIMATVVLAGLIYMICAYTSLYSDNERGITAIASDFDGAGITLHQSGPGMHVHVIERAIRHVKELARGTRSGLPYNCPIFLFRLLVVFVTTISNFFPESTRTDGLAPFQLLYA